VHLYIILLWERFDISVGLEKRVSVALLLSR
jgi:hypothetical protein